MIYDATVCPQDIAYPTDLGLLNKAREITEEIIDELHEKNRQGKKPRTYREIARKVYLKVAQNKKPSKKVIQKGIRFQLQYLRRNFMTIEKQLNSFVVFPLNHRLQRTHWMIQTLYEQQLKMYESRSHLTDYVEKYWVPPDRERFGFYPAKVLADKLYCSRENRKWLKEKDIKLAAKPLGRPSTKTVENYVSPGERNPIEAAAAGKFGQAKNGYGRYEPRRPDQGKTQKHQPILDRLHHPSAQPGQIGRGSIIVPEFFSGESTSKAVECILERTTVRLKVQDQSMLPDGLVLGNYSP